MSEQTKPVSKWQKAKVGGLWASKDEAGKIKNFSGSVKLGGKEYKLFVGKRLHYDNDDPAKKYPDLIIYDSALLDEGKNQPAAKTAKSVSKKVTIPVDEPDSELV